jgi:hypothetical protein
MIPVLRDLERKQETGLSSTLQRRGRRLMAHEIAKLMLEHASTFLDRREAIKTAVSLGMPLHEIEEYLDWLDFVRAQSSPRRAMVRKTSGRQRNQKRMHRSPKWFDSGA